MTDNPVRAIEQVMTSELDGELVLMNGGTGQMHRLNSTGALLWRCLPATTRELAAALQEEFGLSEAQARADADAWVAQMQARELVSPA